MNIEARIQRLEERRRHGGGSDGPLTFHWADRDADGNVIACEGRTVPLKLDPAAVAKLGPILAGMAVMVREPFNRATCPYVDCEYRDTCRADGSLTTGRSANSRNS